MLEKHRSRYENNDLLKKIVDTKTLYGEPITRQTLARLCMTSLSNLGNWLARPETKYYQPMPDRALRLLQLELQLVRPAIKREDVGDRLDEDA